MTNHELMQQYRTTVLDLQELEVQLNRAIRSGRPSDVRSPSFDHTPGTNDPVAASMQEADGLEAMIARKRGELAEMAMSIGQVMAKISGFRTFMVVQQYYLQASTDAQIGLRLGLSRARVNQIRLDWAAQAG